MVSYSERSFADAE